MMATIFGHEIGPAFNYCTSEWLTDDLTPTKDAKKAIESTVEISNLSVGGANFILLKDNDLNGKIKNGDFENDALLVVKEYIGKRTQIDIANLVENFASMKAKLETLRQKHVFCIAFSLAKLSLTNNEYVYVLSGGVNLVNNKVQRANNSGSQVHAEMICGFKLRSFIEYLKKEKPNSKNSVLEMLIGQGLRINEMTNFIINRDKSTTNSECEACNKTMARTKKYINKLGVTNVSLNIS